MSNYNWSGWNYGLPWDPSPFVPPWKAEKTWTEPKRRTPAPDQPAKPAPPAARISRDELRKMIRQELADLIPVNVPDAPPEAA